MWRGKAWGHPVWLVAYRDLPVEEDTIPLHLLDREPAAPRALGDLVVSSAEMTRRFANWLIALQPELWEEIRHMDSTTGGPIIDWERLSKFPEFKDFVRTLPPDRFIQALGIDRAVEALGADRVIAAIGLDRVIAASGLDRVIEVSGAENLLKRLFPDLPPEQLQEMLRLRQPKP